MTTTQSAVAVAAIAALVVLEYQAIGHNIDGAIFGIVIAAIAGLGGYILPSPFGKK